MDASAPAVEAIGLVKRYGDFTAVKGLDLTVAAGDVYGVLGPNGAGKTTFMRMLFGLISPDQGSVRVFGRSVAEHGVDALAPVAGFIETPRFYGYLSARKNLRLLARLDLLEKPHARIDEVLETVELADRRDDRVSTYSYGMRQRLGVAAALLRDPQLLVIDEPTNGLDPAGMRDMRVLIRRLAATGLTVLLSSHHMQEVEEICRHVTIMRRGEVAYHGSLEALRALAPDAEYSLATTDPDTAEAVCGAAPGVAGVGRDGGVIRFTAGESAVERLTFALANAGIAIRSLAPRRGPLETLFFQYTGEEAVA